MKELTSQQKRKIEKLAKIVKLGDIATLEHLIEVEDKLDETITTVDTKIQELNLNKILERIKGKNGVDGEQGIQGYKGDNGTDGKDGKNGLNGLSGRDGKDGQNGNDGKDGSNGLDGRDGINGKNINPDTGNEIINKINFDETSLINKEKISGNLIDRKTFDNDIATLQNRTQLLIQIATQRSNSSAGSGVPSGSNTQVQFNDSGVFGGDAGLTYNKTTDALTSGSFIKTGGTSSEFLKANGSVDSTVYSTNPMTTIGDIIYGGTAGVPTRLADVATGNALVSGGIGVAPAWGKIALTTHVSGTLPVANGGTGATTFTNDRVLTGNGTSAIVDEAALTFDGTILNVGGNINLNTNGSIIVSAGLATFDTSGNIFVKVVNSTALKATAITEQQRLEYDVSNYYSVTVGSTGDVTFDASGSGPSFTFLDSVNITSSIQCNSIVNGTGLAHGTYTPTLSNTTNVDASTARLCTYMRIGGTVTVSGQLDIDPTTTLTATLLGISLPIASALTTAFQLGGTASATAISGMTAGIEADATNDRASLKFIATDVSNQTMCFTFTYQVI